MADEDNRTPLLATVNKAGSSTDKQTHCARSIAAIGEIQAQLGSMRAQVICTRMMSDPLPEDICIVFPYEDTSEWYVLW